MIARFANVVYWAASAIAVLFLIGAATAHASITNTVRYTATNPEPFKDIGRCKQGQGRHLGMTASQ
jgi:hypothetical protein